MSYFNTETTNTDENQKTSEETNQNTNVDNNEDWLKKVVEAKGNKFADPQVLAKSVVHSATHIDSLEKQLKELTADLSKQDYAKNLLEEIREQKEKSPTGKESFTNSSQDTEKTSTEQGNTTQNVSEEVLKGLIETTLTQREAANTANQNLQVTESKLSELYGTEVETKMNKVASDLGMSKERLQEIAAESPTAFFKLVGEKVDMTKQKVVNQGTVNTATGFMSQNNSSVRNFNYYQNLRREDPKGYYKPKVQLQMNKDAEQQGDSFFT